MCFAKVNSCWPPSLFTLLMDQHCRVLWIKDSHQGLLIKDSSSSPFFPLHQISPIPQPFQLIPPPKLPSPPCFPCLHELSLFLLTLLPQRYALPAPLLQLYFCTLAILALWEDLWEEQHSSMLSPVQPKFFGLVSHPTQKKSSQRPCFVCQAAHGPCPSLQYLLCVEQPAFPRGSRVLCLQPHLGMCILSSIPELFSFLKP